MTDPSRDPNGDLRYRPASLAADGARAALGLGATAGPLILVDPVVWVAWALAGGAALFAGFGLRVGLRALSRHGFDETGLWRDGPLSQRLRWAQMERVKLRYYATRRNREGGWFVLTLTGPKARISVESGLEGFEALAEAAARAAARRGVRLDATSEDNFLGLGIRVDKLRQTLAENAAPGEDGRA